MVICEHESFVQSCDWCQHKVAVQFALKSLERKGLMRNVGNNMWEPTTLGKLVDSNYGGTN